MNEDWKGLNLAELIDLLEPVPEPAPISMMPQTVGWIWLGAVLLVVLIAGLRKFWLYRQKSAYRRLALAELSHCPDEPAALAELLRRTAIAAYSRKKVAALYGAEWLAFLDQAYGGNAFTDGPGRAVAAAPYQPGTDSGEMKAIIRTWIKKHKDGTA